MISKYYTQEDGLRALGGDPLLIKTMFEGFSNTCIRQFNEEATNNMATNILLWTVSSGSCKRLYRKDGTYVRPHTRSNLKAPTKLSTRLTVLQLTTRISIGRKSTVPTVTVKQLQPQEKMQPLCFQKRR